MDSISVGPRSLDSRKTDDTTSEIPAVSDHRLSVSNIHEGEPVKLSSYIVDPSAAYESKSSWKSTVYALTKVVIDAVKESSDVFTPLKAVAGGLSAVLKHYDVRCSYLATLSAQLTFVELASDGESPNGGIINTSSRGPCGVTEHTCS